MTRLVVDANLAVALVVPLPYSQAAQARWQQWSRDRVEALAPMLWGYEVTSALRKVAQAGRIDPDAARVGLERILDLGVHQVAADPGLHLSALRWAERLGSTVAYDAAYVALAEERGAELWTADERLVNAARAQEIEWVRRVGETP